MCVSALEENIGIVANSLACLIWIVNDITDCKTCLCFYFSIVCVMWCVCVSVCLSVSIVRKYWNSC